MAIPTIKDVAIKAGVSTATVSRVINNKPTVSRELAEKVNQAIQSLGYYPNSNARTLKYESSKTVGFVVSDIANTFFTTMARGIENILALHGYNLFVCSTDDDGDREKKCISLLMEKQVDGIIINTSGKNNELVTRISHQIPVVLFGREISNARFKGDLVDNDNVSGLQQLTQYLLKLGHIRIGLLNGQSYVSSAQERFLGFQNAMKTAGIEVNNHYPYLFHGHFNRISSGMEGANHLFQQGATAIICANNLLTMGALRFCQEAKICIPKQLSLCGFGTMENSELLYIRLTCADQAPFTMGIRLGELIIERIESKNTLPNREIRFSANLITGNSTGRLA
ncbi:MAG: LacI family DNA-binding transcriptional regulator [Candidatus Choladocola sp.]|nr:LacI family DNA-binding transcriptional regulator [Candidatus Choladocola sp.]